MSRRRFLLWVGGGWLLGATLGTGRVFAGTGTTWPHEPERTIVPGERIRLWWPPVLDPSRALVQVVRDGVFVGHAPVRCVGGPIWRYVEFEARPPSPVCPGYHEFRLVAGPWRLVLGGFRIVPFRFGC